MADNGHNGNGREKAWGNIKAQWKGLGAAEVVGAVVSGAGVSFITYLSKFSPVKAFYHWSAKTIVEPVLLDPAEAIIKKVCWLEECQPDTKKSRLERAENLTEASATFVIPTILNYGSKIAMRKWCDRVAGIEREPYVKTGNVFKDVFFEHIWPDKHDRKIFFCDETTHIGSMFLMNTVGAKPTDDTLKTVSKILQKAGLSKKNADNIATWLVVWEVPNVLGFIAGGTAIVHDQLAKHH